MTTQLTLDSFAARKLKDNGIERILVSQEPWIDAALRQLDGITCHIAADIPADKIRQQVQSVIGKPNHPNAWGALFRVAMRKGLLVDTGRMVKSTITTSHSRRIPVYRVA